jgi:aspartate aminotransferase
MTDLSAFRASSRLNGMGVSEILVRSGQAAAFKRAGRDMIILGAGEPDFDTPDHIKAAAYRAIADGQTKYTILDGSLELKEAVQAKFERENQLSYEIREISCGAGAKQILYNAFMASLDSGDEVVIPTPYWTSYADIVKIAGGNPVEVSCGEESGFLLSPDRLEAAITDRTRWLLINSPSNPSGAAYSADDLRALAEVLRRHPQVWLMSDDMYEHILYDDRVFVTFAQVASDLRERTLTVNGVSKAYAMTGWRLGYCAGPAPLIAAVVSRLNEIEGISCRLPDGAFYAYPSCAGVIGLRTLAGVVLTDDRAFADYLMEWDVAVIPGSCFGLAPFFRISYATSERELLTALDRIDAACHALVPAEAAMPV